MPIRIAKLAALIFACALACAATTGTAQAVPKPSRAVSLNAITAAIKSGSATEQAKSLCGITSLRGYIPDPASKDIVLLGVVDPHLPPLHLDDLVVALRSVWGVYDRIVGRVRYISDPGCSIDPNPAVIAQLRDFQLSWPNATGTDDQQARTEAWKNIGKQPQNVRIMGVPFDCRFAKVMVDADYYMKRIVNGSVALGIDGLSSLSDMDIEARRQLLRAGKNSRITGGSLSRFWFSPGDTTYEVRDGATILRSCNVKLLTEEEYLTEHGAIAQMGRPDPAAGEFARSFSERYDQIAAQRPIYKKLKALFAYVAIARLMKDDRADRTAGTAISYLLRSYKVPTTPVSRAVNGLTEVRVVDETVDAPDGQAHLSLIQSTCGGVTMNVRPRRIKTYTPSAVRTTAAVPSPPVKRSGLPTVASHAPAKAPKVRVAQAKSIKHVVLSSRKSPTAMSWDVPVQLD